MGKTIEQWEACWNATAGNHFDKSLELLREYAGYFPNAPIAVSSSAGRFFTGRWRTKNGSAIRKAIEPFYASPSTETRSIENLYEKIRACMKAAQLKAKRNGDLYKILSVIHICTGVFFPNEDEIFITTTSSIDGYYYPTAITDDSLTNDLW